MTRPLREPVAGMSELAADAWGLWGGATPVPLQISATTARLTASVVSNRAHTVTVTRSSHITL